jgi:hypothetical protein
MVPCSRVTPPSNPKWKRVLLKIGGTALAGEAPHNVDPKVAFVGYALILFISVLISSHGAL